MISFILNFAVFGAAGEAHAFPEWYVLPKAPGFDSSVNPTCLLGGETT